MMRKICCLFWLSFSCLAYSETRYVAKDNPHAVSPYTNWATAAATIQDTVDAAQPYDIILVTNGVYDTGGRAANGALTNRVAITKPLVVRSVNGPEVTIIQGDGLNGNVAIRCVYLGENATLIGFTLTNGHARSTYKLDHASSYGGGIFCEPSAVLSNCVLTGNSTGNSAQGPFDAGGGAYGGTLYNCALTGNSASIGGGAYGGTLYNCTLIGNSANIGGGADYSTLYNCIVYYNTAYSEPNFYSCILNYCCTTPDPGGEGNITNDPLFVNYAGGNLRLQSNSPCINRGINQDWMAGSTDLDGNPRIRRSRVDMGAYESDYWGQFSDVDADGLCDWIEVYQTGTDPTNAASYLGMVTPLESDGAGTGIVVRWQSATDKTYRLVRSTNLMEDFLSLSNHLDATSPMNVYTDRTAIGAGPWFYRVGLE